MHRLQKSGARVLTCVVCFCRPNRQGPAECLPTSTAATPPPCLWVCSLLFGQRTVLQVRLEHHLLGVLRCAVLDHALQHAHQPANRVCKPNSTRWQCPCCHALPSDTRTYVHADLPQQACPPLHPELQHRCQRASLLLPLRRMLEPVKVGLQHVERSLRILRRQTRRRHNTAGTVRNANVQGGGTTCSSAVAPGRQLGQACC